MPRRGLSAMDNLHRLVTLEELKHPFMERIAPILLYRDTTIVSIGTCTILTPHLAITAKHVIEEIKNLKSLSSESIELDILIPQITTGCIWYVSQIFAWVGTDIAFLRLLPRNEKACLKDFLSLKMTIDLPSESSEITALGYSKTELSIDKNNEEETILKLNIYPSISVGTVQEIYGSCRDKVMVRFPSFRVNADFRSGMSGGAVFNNRKELCGLVCAGFEYGSSNEVDSIAVSLWPAMLIKIRFNGGDSIPSGFVSNKEYTILDLARSGYLDIDGHERIEFFKHENGSDGVRRRPS